MWARCSRGRSSIRGARGRNHLRVLATAAGLPHSRVEEVLRLVELDGAGNKRVKAYSLGMRQRLSLAGALLGDPSALVLDEPANGLDPQGIRWLRDFLRGQAGQGRTVLVSSHVLAEMAQTVDEVVVISRGKLVAQGSLDELTAGAEAPVWVRSPEPDRLQAALNAQDGLTAEPGEAAGGWLAVKGASLETVGTTRRRERDRGVRAVPRRARRSRASSSTSPPARRRARDPAGDLRAPEAAHHAHVLGAGGLGRRARVPARGAHAHHRRLPGQSRRGGVAALSERAGGACSRSCSAWSPPPASTATARSPPRCS